MHHHTTTRTESPEARRSRLEHLDREGLEPTYNRGQWFAGAVVVVILFGTALGGFLSALEAVTR